MNRRLLQWELTLVVLTLAAAAWSAMLSPYYLSVSQILYSTRQFVYPGILAIGLAVVVIFSARSTSPSRRRSLSAPSYFRSFRPLAFRYGSRFRASSPVAPCSAL